MAEEQVTIEIKGEGAEKTAAQLRGVSRALKGLKDSGDKAGDGSEEMDQKNRRAAKGLQRMKILAAAAATGGILVFKSAIEKTVSSIVEATKKTAEFQFQIAKAAARADLTKGTLNEFKDAAREASATSAFGANEAAQALTELSKAGFSAQESQEALRDTLRTATAGQESVAKATDVATGILKSFRMETDELGQVNDVLAEASTSSKTSIAELGQALGTVGSASSQAGLSLSETTSFIAKMQDKGLSASRASIALRRALSVLSDPTSTAHKELKALGIQFEKNSSTGEKLFHMLEQLQGAGNKVGKMAQVLGVRAGPTLQAALTQGTGAIKDFAEQVENADGKAKKLAEFQLDNLMGVVKKLKGSLDNLMTRAFGPFSKALQPIAQDLLDQVNALQKNDKFIQQVTRTLGKFLELGANLLLWINKTTGALLEFAEVSEMVASKTPLGFMLSYTKTWKQSKKAIDAASRSHARASGEINEFARNLGRTAGELQGYTSNTKTAHSWVGRLANNVARLNKELDEQQRKKIFDKIRGSMDHMARAAERFGEGMDKPLEKAGELQGDLRVAMDEFSRFEALRSVKTLMEEIDGMEMEGELARAGTRAIDFKNELETTLTLLNKHREQGGLTNQELKKLRKNISRVPSHMRLMLKNAEKFKKLMAESGEKTEDIDFAPTGGGEGEGEEEEEEETGPNLDDLKFELKLAKAQNEEEKRRIRLQKKLADIRFNAANEEERILKEKIAKLKFDRKSAELAAERQKQRFQANAEARKATMEAKREKRLMKVKNEIGWHRVAQEKEKLALAEKRAKQKEIEAKFEKKRQELAEESPGEGLTSAQRKQILQEKELELSKLNKETQEKLRQIEEDRVTAAQKIAEFTKKAEQAQPDQFASDAFDTDKTQALADAKGDVAAREKKIGRLQNARREAQAAGRDQEAEHLKNKIKLQKNARDTRKRELEQQKKQIQKQKEQLEQIKKYREHTKGAMEGMRGIADNASKISKSGVRRAMTQVFTSAGEKDLEKGSEQLKKFREGMNGLVGVMGGAQKASMQFAQAFGAGLKEQATIAAAFQTAMGIARLAQAAMGDPKALFAATTHFASAGAFAAMAGKAPKGGGGGGGGGGGAGSGPTGDVTDEAGERETRGELNYIDFSGATLLEGAPGVQKDINNATNAAQSRSVQRRRQDG